MSNERERVHREAAAAMRGLLATREPYRPKIYAKQGNGAGVVDVPGRADYIYVRLYGSDALVKQALNQGVVPEDGVAVEVEVIRGKDGVFGYVVTGLNKKFKAAGGSGTGAGWFLQVRDESGGVTVYPVTSIRVPTDHLTDHGDGSVSIDFDDLGHTVQDEGVDLTTRGKLNFVGSGVTATDDAGNDASKVTIPLWAPVTNGDPDFPELVFVAGDVVMAAT